jgi:hypothetical protein
MIASRPARLMAAARDIAHAHGLSLIVAPALNLTTLRPDPAGGPRWKQFLRLGLASSIAKVTDVLEIQAQSLERSTSTYAEFVRGAGPGGQSPGGDPGRAVHEPARCPGHQRAAHRRDPRHPRGRGRLLAEHPRPRAALPHVQLAPAGRGPGRAAGRVVSQSVPDR